jgi:hypothetical protein
LSSTGAARWSRDASPGASSDVDGGSSSRASASLPGGVSFFQKLKRPPEDAGSLSSAGASGLSRDASSGPFSGGASFFQKLNIR